MEVIVGAGQGGGSGALSGTSLSVGGQTPAQYQVLPQATGTITTSSASVTTIPVASGTTVVVDMDAVLRITLPTPGLQISGRAQNSFRLDNLGGALGVPASPVGPYNDTGTGATNSFHGSGLAGSVGVNEGILTMLPITPFTWTNGMSVTGALLNSTSPPTGIGANSCTFVVNGPNVYVYVSAGTTDATGSGPNETDSTVHTDGSGGPSYYYVGPASAGVPLAFTFTFTLRPG